MNKKSLNYILMFLGLTILVYGIFIRTDNKTNLWSNNDNKIKSFPVNSNEDIRKRIEAYNEEHKIEPIDAKVDRVWKAIPGYNGLSVDIDKSLDNMKSDSKFNKEKIIYKELPPKVHLQDLEPNPIYRGNPEKPMVSLIINVAWGDEYIPKILEILDKNKVKAIFSFDGSWVKKNPDLARKVYEKGHEIGNHAYSHPDLQEKSEAETREELRKTNDIIKETLDIEPKWFGPPSGSFNQTTVNVANELGMNTILWTIDTVDWKKPERSEMVNRIVSGVENGAMVLMHPTEPVAEGLDEMIKGIKDGGYKLGNISELMSEERID